MKVLTIVLVAVVRSRRQPLDLQGVYVTNDATPLERPKALQGRAFLTDAEVAELRKRADRIFKGPGSDFTNDNLFVAALANVEHYHNPAGHSSGGSENMIDMVIDNRTSLIVDPPDGKIPPLTPEGRRRKAEADAAAQRSPASWEDTTNSNRCLTFGVPRLGGNFGAGIYSYYQILQTPRYVVFFMEEIHEARIIPLDGPLDGRPHLPKNIRQWDGDSRGHWEGKTLVVDTNPLRTKSKFMGSAENLHLVELFTAHRP